MEVQEKIKVLVTLFDHRAVEILLEVPKEIHGTRLLQSTIDKYTPDFYERCQTVTYSLLYLNLRQKIPTATKQQFFTQFLPTQIGLESFKETFAYVSERLKKAPTLEDLQPLVESAGSGASKV